MLWPDEGKEERRQQAKSGRLLRVAYIVFVQINS